MKVGFDVCWAGTGTGIFAGSGRENTYSPLVDAGLGFGTLPPSLKYLRPFAITAEFSTTAPGYDWVNGTPYVTTFNWGFTLQYSLPYFNSHVGCDRQRLPQASDPGRRVRLPDADPQRRRRRAAAQPDISSPASSTKLTNGSSPSRRWSR